MFISSRDQARFGLLFLRNGKWNNKVLLDPEWIELVQSHLKTINLMAMWWLNKGNRKWKVCLKTSIMEQVWRKLCSHNP